MQGRGGAIVGWTQYLLPIVFLGLIVWAHYILFIGDEREMADCSKTKVFFKELDRMCETVNKNGEVEDCTFYKPHYGCCGYMHWLPDGVEKAMTVLQKWSDEHPSHFLPKTRQSEFLKMFPNAQLNFDGVLGIQPCVVDKKFTSEYCISDHCYKCKIEYWLAEVE